MNLVNLEGTWEHNNHATDAYEDFNYDHYPNDYGLPIKNVHHILVESIASIDHLGVHIRVGILGYIVDPPPSHVCEVGSFSRP